MQQTILHDWHAEHDGMLVPFAGWNMPLHYGSQLEEHHQVRRHAGLFDVSHMTNVDIVGKEAKLFLQHVLANDVEKLNTVGKALYGCMLNEQAGILDDLICYYLGEDNYRLVVNAGTTEGDVAWLKQQAANFSHLTITPRRDLAMMALQGPEADAIAAQVFPPDLSEKALNLKPFNAVWQGDTFIARTGYTGETGFEIVLAAEEAVAFWQQLIDAGAKPCGLGARDTLRLEAGLNLYGTDMDETVTPYESNLTWTVALDDSETGRDFIGKKALLAQKAAGVSQRLRAVVLTGKGILRHGQKVRVGEQEGIVTSGSFAPSLGCSIAFVRVPVTDASYCEVEIRNKWQKAQFIKAPFIRAGEKTFTLIEDSEK